MDEAGAVTSRETLALLFRSVHDGFRNQVKGLDREALNWHPAAGANSIAILVTHTLGSEREMIRAVRSLTTERDRDAEFRAEADANQLLVMLDRADREVEEHVKSLTPSDLSDLRPRGDRPPRKGIEWLISNYGHAREHLAQVELTKQLYESRR
ncbi:MAG TPA: DinB family protein [Patescibacteria group bacterium]|nr:DinB family protein [Patescibacteria group bacterium]